MTSGRLVEGFFRHEYGQLVATLVRRVGVDHLALVEDAAQHALLKALETWPAGGQPDNPSAWLVRVAQNELMSRLRQSGLHRRLLEQAAPEDLAVAPIKTTPTAFAGELPDDLLRMLFVCCDPAISTQSQLVLAMKTLCGFDVREIALRLFSSEARVYKQLERARKRLQQTALFESELSSEAYGVRLSTVRKLLYLMFSEGHLSTHPQLALRRELCTEAIRLTTLLARHPIGRSPESAALLALMHLHAARFDARAAGDDGLLLLEEQDRSRWDQEHIGTGLTRLAESAQGEHYSRYHAEAGIAAEHCLAPSFEQTRWDRIVGAYELLEQLTPSPIHRLNRALALAQWQGPAAGLALLTEEDPPDWMVSSYLWDAALADLYRRCEQTKQAAKYGKRAIAAAPSRLIAVSLRRRLRVPNGDAAPSMRPG